MVIYNSYDDLQQLRWFTTVTYTHRVSLYKFHWDTFYSFQLTFINYKFYRFNMPSLTTRGRPKDPFRQLTIVTVETISFPGRALVTLIQQNRKTKTSGIPFRWTWTRVTRLPSKVLVCCSGSTQFYAGIYCLLSRMYDSFIFRKKKNSSRSWHSQGASPDGIHFIRAFEFLETFCSIPPSPGRKAVQMPHPRENYQSTV